MQEEEKANEIKIEAGPAVENEGPPPENSEEPGPKTSKGEKVKRFMKGVVLIFRQFSHDYVTRIFLFVMMIAALLLENAIGFAYAVVTIILLVTERKNNWTHGWISYTSISFVVFGAQIYFIAARNSLSKNGVDIANWFGFGLTGGKAAGVFVINFFIFLASILIGLFMYLKSNVLTDLEYKEVQRIYGPVLNKTLEVAENHEFQGRYSEYSEYHNNVSPKEMAILKKDFGSIKLRFYYKKFNRFLERLYHKHGYELSLFFLVILAFHNLNILSIIFVVMAIYFSLPIKCFYNTEPNNKKLKHLKIKWRVFYVLMALDILREYFFRIWFPLSWDINKMLIDEQFNCDPAGVNTRSSLAAFSKMDDYRVCVDSWRGWFTLDVTSTGRLFIYFFTLFLMVCFDKYFVPYKLSRYRYEEGDELDFTNPSNRGIMDHIRFFYYCHFYIIPMLLFIGVGLKLNITGQSDLIGAIYFFVGLAVLYSYKRLLRTKNLVWRSIETLNNVVLLLVVIFQMPLIDCPIALENRHYISLNECIILRTQYNSENDNTLNKINSSDAWYAVIDIIGINKVALVSLGTTYKELMMIIFFLFAIVQRKIWQHPYTKAYVTPYYEKKDKLNYQIAAKYVERVHVKRVITHRAILMDKEATIHYEKKIENKIKEWEDMFEKFDVDMKDNEEREPIREKGQIDLMSGDKTDLCYRIVDQVVAEIPDAHILGASSFMALIRKCNYDVEAIKSEIPYEVKRARAAVVKDLRKIPQINLPPPKALRESILASLRFSAPHPEAAQREEEEQEGLEGGLRIQKTPEREHDVIVDEEHKEIADEKEPLENLRLSEVRSARSRGLALEEVLLEEPLEEGLEIPHVDDHDVSLSPMKSTRIHYGLDFDLYKDEPEKRTFVQKVKLWFIKHIKYTSLIGEIQARLLVGDSVIVLFLNLLLVNIDKITYFVFVLNHLSNANVLSLLLPVSIVVYAALEYPTAPSRYWKVMLYYTGLILMLKFLYQLPFFCGTPAFNFNNIFSSDDYSCEVYLNDPWTLTKRYDYIIGIVKFTGDSSYPVNRGLFRGLFWDVAAFMCLVLVRFAMDSAGVWNHVKIYNSFKYVPQLGEPFPNEYKQDPPETPVNAQNGSQVLTSIAEFPRPSVREEMKPIKATLLSFLRNMFTFNSQASGQAAIRKPGANYYKYMAPLSLVILLYFIFFYSQMVSSETSIADELNQSLFSGGVVIALLICILYMLLERVMFISRETIFKRVIENRAEGDEDDDDLKGEDVKKVILSKKFFTKVVSHYVLVVMVNAFFFYAMIRSLSQEIHGNYVYIYIGYILCSLYLFFSAEQIRYGYPLVVDTRFFHSTDDITVLLFKVYRAVPFLYEITSIMDWTASKTSLSLGQWMRVEDAYSNLFLVKNSMESKKNRRIGEIRGKWERFTSGCLLVFILVVVIILPFLLFSTLNPTKELNNIVSGTINIELQAISETNNVRFSLYQVQNLEIQTLTETQKSAAKGICSDIGDYSDEQLQQIRIPVFSENEWTISYPSLTTLTQLLDDESYIFFVTANWYFNRENSRDSAYSQGLNAKILSDDDRENMKSMLASTGVQKSITISELFPRFLSITRLPYTMLLGTGSVINNWMPFSTDVVLTFVNDEDEGRGRYWQLTNENPEDSNNIVFGAGKEVVIVTGSEKAMASILSSIGSLGIVGFYVTITLAVGRIVRGMFDKSSQNVIYEELPEPNDLLELCDAIYMARKEGNYYKEEKLYNTLVRIYRSPEMLMKLTGDLPPSKDKTD